MTLSAVSLGDHEVIDIVVRFQLLLQRFCALAQRHGVSLSLSLSSASLARYQQYPLQQQLDIYTNFLRYTEVCESVDKEGGSLRDGKSLLWRMIKRLGFHPCSQLFNQIDNHRDIIEIYSPDFIQVFRNLRFLELCSYSLEQIFSYEWYELYRRETHCTEAIINKCRQVFAGEQLVTAPYNLEDHLLEEIFSEQKKKFRMSLKVLSPLFDHNGKVVGLVSTCAVDEVACGVLNS